MRCMKVYSSSCSQIVLVYLQPFRRNSLLKCAPQPKIVKNQQNLLFGSSGSFRVIDVDTPKKLVISACCVLLLLCLSAIVFTNDWPAAVK